MKNNCARILKSASVAALCLAFVACTKSGSDNAPAVTTNSAVTENTTDTGTVGMTASGATRSESNVTGRDFSAGESSSGSEPMSYEQILAAYPVLADRAAFLASIDRAVETDAGTWDLYANGTLVMTLASNGAGGYTVVNAAGGFMADAVHMVSDSSGDQSQGKSSNGIHFVMSSCKAEEPKQEQEKAPEQEQKQEGEKEPSQEQEQDKTPVKDETPKQEPVKEETPKQEQEQDKSPVQEKEETKVEECASIEATLWLEEVEQKQEQEQDKEPVKEETPKQEQEQEKEPVKKEAPKQEQEQDKDPGQKQELKMN